MEGGVGRGEEVGEGGGVRVVWTGSRVFGKVGKEGKVE